MHCHIFHVFAGRKPVAETRADPQVLFAHQSFSHMADFAFHMGLHAIVLLPQILIRSVLPPQHFRQNRDRISPSEHAHEADPFRPARGYDRRHIPLGIVRLRITDILQKFRKKRFRIIIVRTGQRKDMAVSGIPHPLIALRTVRRHFQIITALSPYLIVIKPFHLLILTCKKTGTLHLAMNDYSGQKTFFIGNAGKLHKTESHKTEPGPVFLLFRSLVINGFRLCLTQICRIKASVPVQNLSVAEFQHIAVHMRRVDFHEAGKVLTEIQNGRISMFCHSFDRNGLLHFSI